MYYRSELSNLYVLGYRIKFDKLTLKIAIKCTNPDLSQRSIVFKRLSY